MVYPVDAKFDGEVKTVNAHSLRESTYMQMVDIFSPNLVMWSVKLLKAAKESIVGAGK